MADKELVRLSPVFDRMYSAFGRHSIPPERVLKSMLLTALYSIRGERQFCEQLDCNLLFRWSFNKYFFRNGINIFETKHKKYKFRVYYVAGLETLYMELIEKKWREKFGLPKLCSYSSGR